MNLRSEDGYSTLTLEPCGSELFAYPSLCFSASLKTPDVSGGIGELWFALDAFEEFLRGLATLHLDRSGSVQLASMSPDEFFLEFRALDRLGHLGVRLGFSGFRYSGRVSFPYSLSAGFQIDPTALPYITEAFRMDLAQQRGTVA